VEPVLEHLHMQKVFRVIHVMKWVYQGRGSCDLLTMNMIFFYSYSTYMYCVWCVCMCVVCVCVCACIV